MLDPDRKQFAEHEGNVSAALADGFVARIVALVGEDAEVAVRTAQAEFDRVLTLTPCRRGAMVFTARIIGGWSVVLDGPHLGWWTFGADGETDGTVDAWRVIEQLVVGGGYVRQTWRSSELLDPDGRRVSGPHFEGWGRLRSRRMNFLPYRQPTDRAHS
jgi:hypothetical protein